MSAPREIPRRIVVAGAGQLGMLAALALKQALPASEVLVVATPPDPLALCDRIGTALPYTNRLHDRLGVSEEVLVTRCGGSHRLVMRYVDWGGKGTQGLAAYGAVIDPKLKTAFAKEWGGGPRNARTGKPAASVGEALARAGRFAPPPPGRDHPLSEVDYALRWNVPAYRDLLIDMADKAGVTHVAGRISAIQLGEDGLVAAIDVEGTGAIQADLFIDCTGPRGLLLSGMPGAERVDWSANLPIRALIFAKRGEAMLALEDRCTISEVGWLAEYAGRDGKQDILALRTGVSEADALRALAAEPAGMVPLSPGRAGQCWIGNVIALGDAAAHFEPLGWLNLDLAHRQLGLLLELLPGMTPDPRERGEFNRRAALMADRVRDVVALHYRAPVAKQVIGEVVLSPEMAIALDQFTRRGRLPFFEELPFLVQEWGHVLDALGIAAGEGAMQLGGDAGSTGTARVALERQIEAALLAAPPYGAWMSRVLRGP